MILRFVKVGYSCVGWFTVLFCWRLVLVFAFCGFICSCLCWFVLVDFLVLVVCVFFVVLYLDILRDFRAFPVAFWYLLFLYCCFLV